MSTRPKKLTTVLRRLNKIDAINIGGCGISALAIYRWCKKNDIKVDDRPFIFLWRDGYEWESTHNEECLENGELKSVEVPAHVIIELGNGIYDSKGEAGNDLSFPIQQGYQLNEDELLVIINNIDKWNSFFRRSRAIPTIEQALGINLSDVDR